MDADDAYRMWVAWKFDEQGNVRPGWSNAAYLEWYWENVPKFGTRNCHTTLRK